MNLNHNILLILILIYFRIERCQNKNFQQEYELLYEIFPEFENVSTQNLLMLYPSDLCKCHQKTIIFRYPSFLGENNINQNVTNIIIDDKEYFVGFFISSKNRPKTITNLWKNNYIIRLNKTNTHTNLYYTEFPNNEILSYFNKYQKYNKMIEYDRILSIN